MIMSAGDEGVCGMNVRATWPIFQLFAVRGRPAVRVCARKLVRACACVRGMRRVNARPGERVFQVE